MSYSELFERLQEYCLRQELAIGIHPLGVGSQGIVFEAKKQGKEGRFAVKIHERQAAYVREREAYLRLRDLGVTEVRGCQVPELLDFDDEARVVVMTIVHRPFVLDFGSAHLDAPMVFSEEVMADWLAEKQEQFGAHWSEVQAILREFVGYGIYLEDVKPDNICVR